MTATQMTDFLRASPKTRSWVVSVHSSQTSDDVGTVADGVLRCGNGACEPAVLGTAAASNLSGDAQAGHGATGIVPGTDQGAEDPRQKQWTQVCDEF